MKEKIAASTKTILPIALIVMLLSVTILPMSVGNMLVFIVGACFLVLGMSLFDVGAEMSMQRLGAKVGSRVASTGKLWIIAFISFLIGIMVTVSEPDLAILAGQVADIENMLLILTVSVGVGVFLMIAVLRIFFKVPLIPILIVFYVTTFVISFFLPESFRPLAFDSGGVTTGPMTVPFIMSIGTGIVAARSNSDGDDDSFGITGLCSIGPIISVLVLGIVTGVDGGGAAQTVVPVIDQTREVAGEFLFGFFEHFKEVLIALAPIILFALLFQLITRSFAKLQFIRILFGFGYTLVGLAIFLTGANIGFIPVGDAIGRGIAGMAGGWLLIPVSMLLGFFIVKAEPSIVVLNKLVEQMSAGAIPASTTSMGLSVGVCAALGLSAVRILTGISIMYFLLPGYAIALLLSFFVPRIFVGISFDSGGAASGIMMSAFVLPLCMGACEVLGGNVMTDAFGCVALVAMAPIISIQICGLVYKIKSSRHKQSFISAEETFVLYEYKNRRQEVAYGKKDN